MKRECVAPIQKELLEIGLNCKSSLFSFQVIREIGVSPEFIEQKC
jgi:hypothetical protein